MKHHQTLFCRNHYFQSESFTVYLPPPALPFRHSSAVSSPWKTLHFTHRPFNGPSRCQPTCPLANGHSCSPHDWDFLTLHSLPFYFCFSLICPSLLSTHHSKYFVWLGTFALLSFFSANSSTLRQSPTSKLNSFWWLPYPGTQYHYPSPNPHQL